MSVSDHFKKTQPKQTRSKWDKPTQKSDKTREKSDKMSHKTTSQTPTRQKSDKRSDNEWSTSSGYRKLDEQKTEKPNKYNRINSKDKNNGYDRSNNKYNASNRKYKPNRNQQKYEEKTRTRRSTNIQPSTRSAGSWKPTSLSRSNSRSNSRSSSRSTSPTRTSHIKTIQGHLNKITSHTFNTLSIKIITICQDNPELLADFINCIFEQALLQPAFCKIYANLCGKIHEEVKGFRKGLLMKCQVEFERGSKEPPKDLNDQAKEIFIYKAKVRMLGNIKFIGELFLTNILVVPVMYECFDRLFESNSPETPDEEQTEALCNLIINVGETMDTGDSKRNIDDCFAKLLDLKNGKQLKARLRYKIEDIVDLRNNKWCSIR